MIDENHIILFLKEHNGQATLEEVANGLGIAKYGPNSAYSILQSLRQKGIVERSGDVWILTSTEITIVKAQASQKTEKENKEKETASNMESIVKVMAKTFAEAIKETRAPPDEWELATKPMKTEIQRKEEKLSTFVQKPDEAPAAKKPLLGLATGTFLDELFLTVEGKPLGGIPICGQFAITGLPGAGKSILVEEIAVKVSANGKKVLFATAEDVWKSPTPRFDLQSRLKQKAEILGLEWDKIRENLFVLDTVMYPELREWNTFAETYRYVVEKEKIELAIIDSVTVLESYRGALKYRVMELARYNQLQGTTGLFVNQRSAETWDTYDMAGGIGLAHNLDGTIIVDYGRVYWQDQQVDLEANRGEFVRIARILDCRMCNFERRRIRIDITPDGFIRAIEPLKSSIEA
jgi:KaiC/GvpD/RAD55 family RecA-like ATPase/predicted transcriptional regulator